MLLAFRLDDPPATEVPIEAAMGLFDGLRPAPKIDVAAVRAKAERLVGQEDFLGAERAVQAAIEDAKKRGARGPVIGELEFELAKVLLACRDVSRAVEALRRASEIPSTDEASTKDRLAYIRNLGEVLIVLGSHDEAERWLRLSVESRREFYGPDSEGLAFGQEALAELLLATGSLDEAQAMADQALAVLGPSGNDQAASVLALSGEIAKARSPQRAGWTRLDDLDPARQNRAAEIALQRASRTQDPARTLASLEELFTLLEARGAPPELLIDLASGRSNMARASGAHRPRLAALEWLRGAFLAADDQSRAIDVRLAIALAAADAEQSERATAEYALASAEAAVLADPEVTSRVERNRALYLAEIGRRDEAALAFGAALEAARTSGSDHTLGRSLVAAGIFRQHAGELSPATEMLEQALTLLPPADPDALCGRSHLLALKAGKGCGCGDKTGTALSEAIELLVREELPAGLLDRIAVELEEGSTPNIRVHLLRQPTEQELALLDQVVRQANAEVRRRYTALYGR